MCEDHYLPNEFNYIIYQATSGGISSPDSDARIDYYGIGGFPTLQFDGSWETRVGAGGGVVDGEEYIALIDERRLTTAPLAVFVSDYSFEPGAAFAEVGVRMFADYPNSNHKIRIAVVADELRYAGDDYDNTLRDMLPDQVLTISADGEEQTVNVPITMDPAWDPENLFLVAFVQDDSSKEVINSGSSRVGEFAAVAGVDGPQQVIAEDTEVTFATSNLINVGIGNDTFDVSIDTSQLPAGWDADLLYDGGQTDAFTVNLDPYGSAEFNVVMTTGGIGSGRVTVEVASQGSGETVASLDFVALAPGTDILVVADDDGAGTGASAYGPAIDAAGKTYAIWDRSLAPISGPDLLDYEAVVWSTGSKPDALQSDDRSAIGDYLDVGGNLILAGEDILQTLYEQGGGARLWYQFNLRLNYGGGDSGDLNVTGEPGDPVGDGLSFTLAGGDPDVITLFDGEPVETSFTYGDGDVAGARTTYDGYQVLTLPFGLERIPGTAERDALMEGAFDWFGILEVTPVEDLLPGAGLALRQNAPNPFNPATTIAFRLEQAGPAELAIYDTRGQRVRTLVSEALPAGNHEVVWDGQTDRGTRAASGTYFYRLTAEQETLTRKMTLVK